jgi:hypothetical protein
LDARRSGILVTIALTFILLPVFALVVTYLSIPKAARGSHTTVEPDRCWGL